MKTGNPTATNETIHRSLSARDVADYGVSHNDEQLDLHEDRRLCKFMRRAGSNGWFPNNNNRVINWQGDRGKDGF